MIKAITWMGVLLLMASRVIAAPGQVHVSFVIESEKFKNGLQAATTSVETELSKRLAAHLQTPFPLIEWKTVADADTHVTQFKATLIQDNLLVPNIRVSWSAHVGDADVPMPELDDIVIYQYRDIERPYRSPGKLIEDVDAAINAWIRADVVAQKLHDQFVTQVPLATRIDFDVQRKAVVIPLEWQRSKIGDESVFRIEYKRANPLGKFKIKLNGVSERLSSPLAGDTQCIVSACSESGAPVTDDVWNSCITILLGPNAPPISVGVDKYRFNANLDVAESSGTVGRP